MGSKKEIPENATLVFTASVYVVNDEEVMLDATVNELANGMLSYNELRILFNRYFANKVMETEF